MPTVVSMRSARQRYKSEWNAAVKDIGSFREWARRALKDVSPSELSPKLAQIVHGVPVLKSKKKPEEYRPKKAPVLEAPPKSKRAK